jgi:hypothetical protein
VILWLEEAKSSGGYLSFWEQRIFAPVSIQIFGDRDAHRLYILANHLNLHVLDYAFGTTDTLWVAAFSLKQSLDRLTGLPVDLALSRQLESWNSRFASLYAESVAMKVAVQSISKSQFSGHDPLFPDVRALLENRLLHLLGLITDAINPLSEYLGISPINVEEPSEEDSVVSSLVISFLALAEAEQFSNEGQHGAAAEQLRSIFHRSALPR